VPERRVLLVDRPGASQSELRVGHVSPPRRTPHYHALVTMNAVLGGQFASRINRTLREERGVTYGARTWFEFRRYSGSFACETSVQADATVESLAEILRQLDGIRQDGAVGTEELDRAKASLTRGYVRNFETPVQLARAMSQLATHALPPSIYDEFVPAVRGVSGAEAAAVASRFVRPEECALVVVGDASLLQPGLEQLGRPVAVIVPEF
jgi:zinc protease